MALLGDAGALQVKAGIMFMGHADAAMQLDHLRGYAVQRLAGGRLGKRGEGGERRIIGINRRQRGFDRRSRQLQFAEAAAPGRSR
jgi:hypothetical protein